MERFFHYFLTLTGWGVATVDGCLNINRGLADQVQMPGYAIQRQFQILLNVIAKGFQRRDVEDFHPIR